MGETAREKYTCDLSKETKYAEAMFPGGHTQPVDKAPMPARAAALSKHDALKMLQEVGTKGNLDSDPTTLLTASTERTSLQPDLAEELVHRASPR